MSQKTFTQKPDGTNAEPLPDAQSLFFSAFEAEKNTQGASTVTENRQDAFFRLLVGEIVPLFSQGLSRRVLPGLFAALETMLGARFLTHACRLCNAVVKEHQTIDNPAERWRAFHGSPITLGVLLDAQVVMVNQFRDCDKRMDWFINIVNDRTERAPIGSNDAGWQLERDMAFALWQALFSRLRQAAADPDLHSTLLRRHGHGAALEAIAQALAIRQVHA